MSNPKGKQIALKGQLTSLKKLLDGHPASPLSAATYKQIGAKLQEYAKKVDVVNEEIVCAAADVAGQEAQQIEYEAIIVTLHDLMTKHHGIPDPAGSQRAPNVGDDNGIRLPKIELPVFSGDLQDWTSFYDLFTATIHSNSKLSNCQKLQYLKSALKGDAAGLIQALPTTDGNYDEAWTLLRGRYDNRREIVHTHLRRLFKQPHMKDESAAGLRQLIDVTNECTRALKVLQRPVEHWDDLLVFLVAERLDSESHREWILSLATDDPPEFAVMLKFLDQRARALSESSTTSRSGTSQGHGHRRGSLVHYGSQDVHYSSCCSCDDVQPVRRYSDSSSPTMRGSSPSQSQGARRPSLVHHATGSPQASCPACQAKHQLMKCPDFQQQTVAERIQLVKQNRLCFNCLRPGHFSSECSGGTCRTCQGHHHTLLHVDKSVQHHPHDAETSTITGHVSHNAPVNTVLLATALVTVKDVRGNPHTIRVFLDDGSKSSFVTEACVNKLGLPSQGVNVSISGISGAGLGVAHRLVELHLTSLCDAGFSLNVEALVLPKVTQSLPTEYCKQFQGSHLKNLTLADPSYYIPGHIDVLLGADVKADVILAGVKRGRREFPVAQETKFGWVVTGRARASSGQPGRGTLVNHALDDFTTLHHPKSRFIHPATTFNHPATTFNHPATTFKHPRSGLTTHTNFISGGEISRIDQNLGNLDATMRKFWEIEELPPTSTLNAEEKACELHFIATHTRGSDGRFMVRLPFRSPRPSLGDSRSRAVKRFQQMESRLKSSPDLCKQYREFMKEYSDLGHMTLVPVNKLEKPIGSSFYLPHHAVLKESSSTTKLRVVFDASAKSSSGRSLNDTQMVGAKLQDDLFQILVRFRFHLIALCADVCKMYRQILMHPDDIDFQRILWRDTPTQPIQEYWLKTVTYGTASAPYLAVRCLQQLAMDGKEKWPLASAIWLKDSYVDDLVTGASSESNALQLQAELREMMRSAQLDLRKWSSNNAAVLEAVPVDMREANLPLTLDGDKAVKTLGLVWQPASDEFTFAVNLPPPQTLITKRSVLSEMSMVFDPLGWLSPVTISAKILFQQLWRINVDWDDNLPEAVGNPWRQYREALPCIQSLSIPRCVVGLHPLIIDLHGFCDASESAYAAVLYVRCTDGANFIKVNLLAAKTKVSPLKRISLPRLELCGALLLSRLLASVTSSLAPPIRSTWAWSDSTVVLAWLASPPHRWHTFVANRVTEIQANLPSRCWHHVRSEENPADCASRGIPPSDLQSHPLWWNGPTWLSDPEIQFSSCPEVELDATILEEKASVLAFVVETTDNQMLTSYSSLNRLQRITAYCLRFIYNARADGTDRRIGALTVLELGNALQTWIKRGQTDEFHDEIRSIQTKKNISSRSRLASLNPYLDKDGLLRVGGRIQLAQIPEQRKHPIILPRKHVLTSLIIMSEHRRLLHAGPQLLLAALQSRFWILSGRDVVRHHIRKCITCVRHRGETAKQMMGNLPKARLTVDRPFVSTGVDYAGPFQLRVLKGRGHKQFKAYICLYICFTTRAIHLEAVSDMTSATFIAALHRFVSRRGKCRDLYSDCGTNFQGAKRELKEALAIIKTSDFANSITNHATAEGINWHFNPPSAPHQGGLWEAGVKSVKFHLHRVLGNEVLNYEEFTTMLCQIEACLNSRPLCPLSSDPSDLEALTPGHFLIGAPITTIPEPNLTTLKVGRLARWQLVQQLVQHFWRRWSSEYLSRLQQRPKWWSHHPNLAVGDLVLVKDDRFPPLSWPLARVTAVHPGVDGQVRVVTLKTANGEFKRPIVKLCQLPIESSD